MPNLRHGRQLGSGLQRVNMSKEKIKAISMYRYRGGVREKRLYGGQGTITEFWVYFGDDPTPMKIMGHGPTPGDRKTYAIEKAKRIRAAGEAPSKFPIRSNPSPPHERRAFTYTTAPADYDWFDSSTVRVVGHDKRGRPIRLVSSDPKHVQSQRERYMSGLHMAADDTEWEKLVKYNLVTTSKTELMANPAGGGLLTVALLVAAGVGAWLIFRKEPETKSCPTPDQLGAFGKTLKYNIWYIEQPLASWTAPKAKEYLSDPKAKAYSSVECSFFKWTGSSWVVDNDTNAELAAYLKPSSVSGAHPFVGLTVPR